MLFTFTCFEGRIAMMEEFVNLHKELLKEEHRAEIQECTSLKTTLPLTELQNRGICVKKLHILSMKTGLYGRTIIKLGLRGAPDRPLPSHNFSSGDLVDLHSKHAECSSKPELQGVVTSVKDVAICVALDGEGSHSKADEFNSHDQSLVMFKTANEVTYRRLQKGLERLTHHDGVASNLIQVLFGAAAPGTHAGHNKDLKYYNESLNASQREAIEFALSQKDLAVIHGPPGTGKTTTIAELISQVVSSGQKILACAPSNVAIDNILEKLSAMKIVKHDQLDSQARPIKMVRLGHPARILTPELHRLSLDALVAKNDAARIVQDIRKDIDKLYSNFKKKHNKKEQSKFREEKKLLSQELRQREKKAFFEILSSADVVLATNVGAHADGPLKHLPNAHFQVVVIDECGQALEASCWIPMLQAPKVILAGDHLQLPPTVKSQAAAEKGLSKSLLERIVDLHGGVVKLLNVQYRMNSNIMKWSSDNLYRSKLLAHGSVQGHLLTELDGVTNTEDTVSPLLLIDTAGCEMPEVQTNDSESIGNPGEAEIVADHVESLIKAGVDPKDVAVISPYNMQVDLLRKILHEKYKTIEIRSVDGFQGREKEAVVISLVRSNEKGIVGFLSDDRRMNVAVTRARRHLALICDSLTVSKHKFLKTLVDYVNENGEVRSAHEYKTASHADGKTHLDVPSFKKDASKTKPSSNSQQQNTNSKELVKIKFQKTIKDFLKRAESGAESHEFSTSLKPHERRAVHELCEEISLNHESIGEGAQRKIIISVKKHSNETQTATQQISSDEEKKNLKKEECFINEPHHKDECQASPPLSAPKLEALENARPLEEDASQKDERSLETVKPVSVTEEEDFNAETILVPCPSCGRTLPKGNIQLHRIHCERLEAMKAKLDTREKENVSKKVKQKKAEKQRKKKSKIRNDHDEKTDDDLLEEAIKENKLCSVSNCQQFVTVIGQTCAFCKKTFCLEHHVPEVQGCGEAARSGARRRICRDGVLYSGSGTPNKNLPPEKHANLQRKMGSKLKEMESKRKPTNKTK